MRRLLTAARAQFARLTCWWSGHRHRVVAVVGRGRYRRLVCTRCKHIKIERVVV